jgi:hypothetical protein
MSHWHLAFNFIFVKEYCDVSQTGLGLMIFLSQPLKCWDYRYVPLQLGIQGFYHEGVLNFMKDFSASIEVIM